MRGLPPIFKEDTRLGKNNNQYTICQTRVLTVGPIGVRKAWRVEDPNQRNDPKAKRRSHVHVLAYLAIMSAQKEYEPWGPVVLSAKGFSAMHLENALNDWTKYTAEARLRYATKGQFTVPSMFFCMPVGTFGERSTETVGQGRQQSDITPPKAYNPTTKEGGVTADDLSRWYVGDVIAGIMNQHNEQAREWLHAWENEDDNSNGGGQASSGGDSNNSRPMRP